MQTIEFQQGFQVGVDEILNGISKLDTGELQRFHRKVGTLLSVRRTKPLLERERALTEKIKADFLPAETLSKFKDLQEARLNETWTSKEHQEFRRILKTIESKSLERLTWLVELSKLRNESLAVTMDFVGIKAVNPYNA